MLHVLHFGLGERGLLDHGPQNRFRTAEQAAVHQEFSDLCRDARLGIVGHRRIGVVPIAHDTKAFEFLALDVNPMVCELTAFLAELRNRNLILILAFGAVLLFDLPLDRQAVAIPTRYIIRVFTHHLLRSVDHIFQDLVQGVTDMEIAVRVWRAIMQNKRLASFGRFAHASP